MAAFDEPEIRLRIAEQLNSKGDLLLRSRRYEEALVCYAQVVERFGDAQYGELGRQVRTALGRKGGALVILDRLTEADSAFDQLCERSRCASNPECALAQARKVIVQVMHSRARVLLKEKRHDLTVAVVDRHRRR
jgi:hypothetical protein